MYGQAIWTGYQLTQEDFIELVSSLPSIRSHFENNLKREPTLVDCISAMMKWRRNLPQRYREKVPRMIRDKKRRGEPPTHRGRRFAGTGSAPARNSIAGGL